MNEKLHVIDGVKYREVERMAEVGEMVIITEKTYPHFDAIFIADGYDQDGDLSFKDADDYFASAGTYSVLEPIEEAPAGASSPDMIDLVSRLIAKVARLESELDTVRKNVQTFAQQTESNTKDIAALDERAQVLNAIQSFYLTGGERQ